MKRVVERLSTVLMGITAFLLAALVVLATLQVITRYFVSAQIIWIEEVSIYMVDWIAAVGIPWMWLRQGHIKMDVLNFVLPVRVLRIMDYIINLVAAVASVAIIRVGLITTRVNSGYVLSVIKMDEGLRYWPVTVAGVLLLVSSILVLCVMFEDDRRMNHAG